MHKALIPIPFTLAKPNRYKRLEISLTKEQRLIKKQAK